MRKTSAVFKKKYR